MCEEWQEKNLGEFATLQRGLSYSSNDLGNKGAPFVNLKSIKKGGGYSPRGLKRFSGSPAPTYQLRPGDLLIANTDLTRDASVVGAPAAVPDFGEPAYFSMDLSRLNVDINWIHTGFLAHRLQLNDVRKFMQARSRGSTVLHLQTNAVPKLQLKLPPLPEQHRIAEILDTVDEAIRKTEQVIAKLEQMKQGLLHDLLTRGIDENGELRDPQRHPDQFTDSPLGRIPRDWKIEPLSDHVNVKGGKRLPSGHSYSERRTEFRYLRVVDFFAKSSVDTEELESLNEATFSALRRYEIQEGHLFISIAGSIGHVGVYRSKLPNLRTILTENAARLVPFEGDIPEFIAIQANGDSVQKQIGIEKGTGGGVPKLALFRIERLQFVWPSIEEQERITQAMKKVNRQVDSERIQLDKFKKFKKGLMNDLLTGRVRVSISEEVTI